MTSNPSKKVTMKKRWTCPECGSGKLLSSAPRKNNTGRYCLKCSERTGVLVERVCLSLEAKRAKKAATLHGLYVVGDIDLMAELKRVWKVATWLEPNMRGRQVPQLTLTRGARRYTSGRAWRAGRIHLSCGTDPVDVLYVLAHEVAHHMVYARDLAAPAHGDIFKAAEAELLAEAGVTRTPVRC